MAEPLIIQGGMGVAVSDWKLASAVSRTGNLGVVSGTALDPLLVYRLQCGDIDGDVRRALSMFPDQDIVSRIMSRYYVEGGIKDPAELRPPTPMHTVNQPKELLELLVAGSFMEVYLAKEGHDGIIGMNLLTKIELTIPASLFGAMLAGVDYIIMGAGIPKEVPRILEQFAALKSVSMNLSVENSTEFAKDVSITFDPNDVVKNLPKSLRRPKFLPIISSNVLATSMVNKSSGKVDGLVIEDNCAGGHNAPPRGVMTLDENNEPVYGAKDGVDLEKIKKLGVPFWLAGGYGFKNKVVDALKSGASGVQVGSLFAFCKESGLVDNLKDKVIGKAKLGLNRVFTDPLASPTGFPFKVLSVEGTLSEDDVYLKRTRVCNMGFLRRIYVKNDGSIGYKCPAEPVNMWLGRGGTEDECVGRKCLCNGLLGAAGYSLMNHADGELEKAIVTAGNYVNQIKELLHNKNSYSAKDVIDYLLSDLPEYRCQQS